MRVDRPAQRGRTDVREQAGILFYSGGVVVCFVSRGWEERDVGGRCDSAGQMGFWEENLHESLFEEAEFPALER